MQPILHPQTKFKLTQYLKQPTHGLLLTAREGTGKLFVAQWIAQELQLNTVAIESLEGKSVIIIDQIRELYNLTRTGGLLAIIIKDAQQMGIEAQNAFLKLLEEPPQNTHFILTAHNADSLLPTIRSRLQIIEVLPPSQKDLLTLVASEFTQDELKSLLYTSQGLPGAFFSLLEPEAYQNHQAAVNEAKKFYTANTYQRHLMCLEHKYNKEWTVQILQLLSIIVRSLLERTADVHLQKKLITQSNLLEETSYNVLKINGNPKIHLARLVQQLS